MSDEPEVEDPGGGGGRAGGTPSELRPAFYAAGRGGWRDWWTILHPPYTAWILGYVVIGASLSPVVHLDRLIATLLAFFLAVGLAAHALDELHGRPLRTAISSRTLVAVTVLGLGGAVALGVAGVFRVGWVLVPFMVVGPLLVVAYNAELFGGVVHTDLGFAVAWGAFPVLTAYVAQADGLSLAGVLGAAAALMLSLAQRALSTPARRLRRTVVDVGGEITMASGEVRPIDRAVILRPLEHGLRAMSWAVVLGATAAAVARFG